MLNKVKTNFMDYKCYIVYYMINKSRNKKHLIVIVFSLEPIHLYKIKLKDA